MSDKVSTKQVQDWWDKNPFTLGVATGDFKNKDLVGRIDAEKMNLEYFQEIERRFRKHSGTGGQEKDKPLLSKFIDSEKIRNKDVLDIAVGTGLHTVMFAAEGARVTGIDITPFAVTQTKKNLEVRGLHGTVLQMDAQKMSFPDSSFDLVNAWGCLMHMPDTKKQFRKYIVYCDPEVPHLHICIIKIHGHFGLTHFS